MLDIMQWDVDHIHELESNRNNIMQYIPRRKRPSLHDIEYERGKMKKVKK